MKIIKDIIFCTLASPHGIHFSFEKFAVLEIISESCELSFFGNVAVAFIFYHALDYSDGYSTSYGQTAKIMNFPGSVGLGVRFCNRSLLKCIAFERTS